ncbi:transcription elongation GreA/GreB family factor [Rhizobium lentis]|uniref:Transcription elongation GreA/GreB family factor n=1 Tax=Rhizobium lentis TaxID=1138194 RepID=A0A7W8UII0_9HYPH|nr:transcription elongation GreA/GreB family factor [Rhizobium lentis]MBB5548118.1 transcription elongation GreA/GreB family factor [Rhizobium lentis]MBB5558646.1 transcription elongation GreA/GreB family factor [Rhizobium lentis]MBB5565830.1 transcription elongation GreA/GreB family factor [Rhizobium lentis]
MAEHSILQDTTAAINAVRGGTFPRSCPGKPLPMGEIGGSFAVGILYGLDVARRSLARTAPDMEFCLAVAFTKEESFETASETLLPDRPVSPHPNLVTEAGLKALELQFQQAREAYDAASTIEDVNERRRQTANPLRDLRYLAARLRTAHLVPDPTSTDVVAFGSTVTFRRNDGRVQTYRIVGEDEADPKAGSISYVSPVARLLMGKAAGDAVEAGGQELEIIAIA